MNEMCNLFCAVSTEPSVAQAALNECFICLIPLAAAVGITIVYLVCRGLFGKGGRNG